MAVAKVGLPQDFEHQFIETGPAPSLLEEISRRVVSGEDFSEACLLDSAYGIADALAALQALDVIHPGISTSSLAYNSDFIKLTLSKVPQADRFKSPLERKKLNHNPYKSGVFSLGICLLEACKLQQIPDFNVPGCLTKLYETVMGLHCEKVMKCLILVCLKHDEAARPDWRTLVEMIKCEGFNLVNYVPVNEAYLLNEHTYEASSSSRRDKAEDRESAGHHSLSNENPPIEEVSAQSVDEPSMVVYVPTVLPTKKVTVVTKVPKKY